MKRIFFFRTLVAAVMALVLQFNTVSADNSPLCFTARNGSVTVKFEKYIVTHTIQYSTNGIDWSTYASGTEVTLNADESVCFRAATNQTVAEAFADSTNSYSRFLFSSSNGGTVEGSGNIMSLYGPDCPDLPLQSDAFLRMFEGCDLLTTAPELTATTLAWRCYWRMFAGCTSLTAIPALHATTLATFCCQEMFAGCTSLSAAPALPATTLAYKCYDRMFYNCTSLITAPALPATTLAKDCYREMFSGCTSLVSASALPATTLVENCYVAMFSGCTSLTTAPALPATTLADNCYGEMFSGCTSLTLAPELLATNLANGCYSIMFYGCSSLKTVPELPATTLADCCYAGMFSNCLSLIVNTTAPGKEWRIPATALATSALTDMFTGTAGTMNGTPVLNTTYYIASDPSTAIENVETEQEYVVFTEGSKIVVNGASDVIICDASGKTIFNGKTDDDVATFEVSVAGIYFVRCDNKNNYRIVVK